MTETEPCRPGLVGDIGEIGMEWCNAMDMDAWGVGWMDGWLGETVGAGDGADRWGDVGGGIGVVVSGELLSLKDR